MSTFGEAAFRAAIRVKNRLRRSRAFGGLYRRLWQGLQYQQIFTNIPVHERMLGDAPRRDAYQRAITRYVQPGHTVIDLGTGTGLLSFMAAGQHPGKIYAIDHADIIDQARHVAAHNGFTSIEFIKTHSKNFTPREKVDVIIQEQIGTHVFDEDMVTSVVDLRERLLKPGGRILPSRFQVFVEPVQVKSEYRVPFLWEQHVNGVSYACLRPWYEREVQSDLAMSYVRPHQVERLLCEPESLIAFDLMTVRTGEMPKTVGYHRRVQQEGRLDGFCMYFRACFDEEIVLSNSPFDAQTNWAMPFLRTASMEVQKGEVLGFTLSMGDLILPRTWRWSLTVESAAAAGASAGVRDA